MHIAHINEKEEKQSCREHSLNTAEYAKEDLACAGLGNAAWLAGIIHDMGKCTDEFDNYITLRAKGLHPRKGSVIHTFAGVSWLLQSYHDNQAGAVSMDNICAEILAFAAGSHHGLFDCIDPCGESGFSDRLNKQPEYDKTAEENFFKECVSEDKLDLAFRRAADELARVMTGLSEISKGDQETYYYISFLTRLILSSVIDGDRKDTEEFMSGKKLSEALAGQTLWSELLDTLEKNLDKSRGESAAAMAEKEVSGLFKENASVRAGVYRAELPSEAESTLSEMRFALAHAAQNGKRRIIYAAPLIASAETAANVILENLENSDVVLEHHSDIPVEEMPEEEQGKYEFLTETWDAPIVVTTFAQLLNTLFSGETPCIRRFQSLAGSVMIIDGVQAVPENMLTLFNLAVNFLYKACGATVLLCSSMQPPLEKIQHPLILSRKKIVPDEILKKCRKNFRRVNLVYKGSRKFEEIKRYVTELAETQESLLVACNTKEQARKIFEAVKDLPEINVFHLSASMCPVHREEVLRRMRDVIRQGKKAVCVSTQVILPYADVSFSCVLRFAAGLEDIRLTAGKCGREEGVSGLAPVYIVNCCDENLSMLPAIQRRKSAFLEFMQDFNKNPEKYGSSLATGAALNEYYRTLYRRQMQKAGAMDYSCRNGNTTLFSLLSDNRSYAPLCNKDYTSRYMLRQAAKTAGESFRAVQSETETLAVPYDDEGETLAEKLVKGDAEDCREERALLRKAKAYFVPVLPERMKKLKESGKAVQTESGVYVLLDMRKYDHDTGLLP